MFFSLSNLEMSECDWKHRFEIMKEIIVSVERVIYKLEKICTPEECPKMIASDEWHFLCAPHADKPRDCAAIDYMKHTVDSTCSLLLAIGSGDSVNFPKQFPSIIRRLYRIYGHIYFHHNRIFEEEFASAARFYFFLKKSGLFKQDMMIIPENVFEKDNHSGTIVDLRTIAIQLSQDDDEETTMDTTVM